MEGYLPPLETCRGNAMGRAKALLKKLFGAPPPQIHRQKPSGGPNTQFHQENVTVALGWAVSKAGVSALSKKQGNLTMASKSLEVSFHRGWSLCLRKAKEEISLKPKD